MVRIRFGGFFEDHKYIFMGSLRTTYSILKVNCFCINENIDFDLSSPLFGLTTYILHFP